MRKLLSLAAALAAVAFVTQTAITLESPRDYQGFQRATGDADRDGNRDLGRDAGRFAIHAMWAEKVAQWISQR